MTRSRAVASTLTAALASILLGASAAAGAAADPVVTVTLLRWPYT